MENIGEQLDPALEPVLQQQKIRDGTSFVIKLGDKSVAYDDKPGASEHALACLFHPFSFLTELAERSCLSSSCAGSASL